MTVLTPPPAARTGARPRPAVAAVCRAAGRSLAHLLFSVRVTGAQHVPRSGPVLLAGNHAGLLDGPLLYLLAPRRTAILAKAEIFVGPLPLLWRWLDVVPVRRGTADRAALHRALEVLQSGGALAVFPEGTRGSGQLESTTDGLAWLALRSGAPVVPVALTGTSEALPRGSWRPRLRAPVAVCFGPARRVDVRGDRRARSTVRAAAEQVRAHLRRHLSAALAGA